MPSNVVHSSMNLTIRTRHTRLFDDFEPLAAEKLARLERWLPRLAEATVEVSHEETRSSADRYCVQITVHAGQTILRAEERAADPRTALEEAADVLARQARRHKTRLGDRHHDAKLKESTISAAFDEREIADDEYVAGKIVRTKRFEAKPMSTEEALAQMDLLGHDFFLFMDAASGEYALLYKRDDGDYGLLAPQRG